MTIGKKLMAGFAAVLLVTLALVTSTLYNVGELSGALETATQKTAKKIFMVSALEGQLFRMGSCQRGIIMFSLLKIPDKAQNNKQEFETRAAAVDTLISQLKPILTTEQGRSDLASIERDFASFKDYVELVATHVMAGDTKGAMDVYNQHSTKLFENLKATAHALV